MEIFTTVEIIIFFINLYYIPTLGRVFQKQLLFIFNISLLFSVADFLMIFL